MPSKNPRLRIQLDKNRDEALIAHLQGCKTGQERRAHLHIFILAALDKDQAVTIDLDSLIESTENKYVVELLIPPSSPIRIREAYKQMSSNLRAVTMRALIRYGYERMRQNNGPSVSSMFTQLETEAVVVRQGQGDMDTQTDGDETAQGRIDHGDQYQVSTQHPADQQTESRSNTGPDSSDIEPGTETLDGPDDQESVSSSSQPSFDMDRLLGTFDQ